MFTVVFAGVLQSTPSIDGEADRHRTVPGQGRATVVTRSLAVAAALALLLRPAVAQPVLTVTDGDTVRLGDERIRLEAIDAPEIAQPECLAEALLGALATTRLEQLLDQPGALVITRSGTDRFGRTLATITIGGVDVALQLIAEGLAQPWRGAQVNWCG